ncbi:hypothetical protein E2C01_068943 [Portunus trituberculatus]|uniref:Uncharacterized protein n=1 Tax=Portunus trituberculatus TaxID=210409 RepID=A0A5B7HY29_PORTR|nr:hypothetical protein [Portunus trituberculatus]
MHEVFAGTRRGYGNEAIVFVWRPRALERTLDHPGHPHRHGVLQSVGPNDSIWTPTRLLASATWPYSETLPLRISTTFERL